MARALIALAVAISAVSCQSNPKVRVGAVSALSYRELIARSPVILTGKVLDVKVVGPEVQTGVEHRYPVRLRRITIEVENVLKGSTQTGEIAFFRYDWSHEQPMAGPWGIVLPGQRDLFFLEREGGVLRSTVDLYRSHIEVLSGRHLRYKPHAGQSTEASVAELLLTPGEDVRPEITAVRL